MNDLQEKFKGIFPDAGLPAVYFSPGRINLIGEHTDYNGGYVFPAAISLGTYALAFKRQDRKLRFYSLNFPSSGIIECSLDNLAYKAEDDWANYPKGMIQYIIDTKSNIEEGLDILFYGEIPNGAGLSSSASIELATGVLLDNLFDLSLERLQIIQLGQKVENEYIGVNSGIMDQFAVGQGKKDYALLLNCQTLEYQYAPLHLEDYTIVIMNTNKRRTLATSKYNERSQECRTALSDLQLHLSIQHLGDLTTEEFDLNAHLIENSTVRRRAKHVVYENNRTLQAYEALEQNDLKQFGLLMNESHLSLQYDYEVTGIELDTLVETAWEQPGVIGARMTGAGFGGCAIAIVEKNSISSFTEAVNDVYLDKIGYDASFYMPTIVDGAKKITKEAAQ
ncbi:galactokinase [Sporosarcina pasteurii]|nr:galactokinase [Sporosarcina pasteurii]MDS9472493.1 galactokinase [Sporosarcina pasteurii]